MSVTNSTAQRNPARWLALSVFVLFSAFNYLDRQLLAALAPTIKVEFELTNAQYGFILSAFSFAYLVVTPVAGWFIDRVGLKIGAMLAIGAWSLASAATGLTQTLRGLIASRVALAGAEAAGIPSASKSTATYLHTDEMGLGDASHAVGITAGTIGAPLVVAALAPLYGWRSVFLLCGLAGLLWIPLCWLTMRSIPPTYSGSAGKIVGMGRLFAQSSLWIILGANILIMTVYSLWMNWTTIYFVQERHLTQIVANQYFAWIPPVFATLGGFTGGWLTLKAIRKGARPLDARLRACKLGAPLILATAAVPYVPSPELAAAAISLSFFGCMVILTNLHILPIDLFGPGRAAFTAALLTCSYALMQTFLSPTIGAMLDRTGFGVVCLVLPLLPLLGVLLVQRLSHSVQTKFEEIP